MKNYLIILFFSILTVASCDKKVLSPEFSLKVKLSNVVDGINLIPDSLIYKNAAGNLYRISRLEYYISGIKLTQGLLKHGDGGVYTNDIIQYVNGFDASTWEFELKDIKAANYALLEFNIGLDTAMNKENYIPATVQNENMKWPTELGGGYHFLKLEGQYSNDSIKLNDFSIHLGRNNYYAKVILYAAIDLTTQSQTINLTMDVNKWFANPNVYDFNVQGPITKGNNNLMSKIKENGQYVFTVE